MDVLQDSGRHGRGLRERGREGGTRWSSPAVVSGCAEARSPEGSAESLEFREGVTSRAHGIDVVDSSCHRVLEGSTHRRVQVGGPWVSQRVHEGEDGAKARPQLDEVSALRVDALLGFRLHAGELAFQLVHGRTAIVPRVGGSEFRPGQRFEHQRARCGSRVG